MLHTKAIFFLGGRTGTESSGLRNAIYRHTFQTNVFLDQAFLKTNVKSFLFCCCCLEVYLCPKEGISVALASLSSWSSTIHDLDCNF